MNKDSGNRIEKLLRNGDYLMAVVLFAVVMLLILPLPKFGLDFLLSVNIGASLLILLVIIYVREPMQFSVFPTLLLVITLYRLSLNISSTRLILIEGDAGKVIRSFGEFVVGGNYVVGGVIFLILVLVNFIVITKGSGRIAEVAARFTLDAMPGKQMAIDAELNAGLIDEKAATKRRQKIQQEADFYGKMDGASKFVRGDAVAGLLITLINVIGGFSIGVLQKGMPLEEALRLYTLLSIGDGLVSQIPALVVSVAAGLLVTRTSGSQNLGSTLARQLVTYPRALGILSAVMAFFAILPGMPVTPFIFLSSVSAISAWAVAKARRDFPAFAQMLDDQEDQSPDEKVLKNETSSEPDTHSPLPVSKKDLQKLTDTEPLSIELGFSLLDMADPKQGGDLLDRITGIRKAVARDMGMILPAIAVRDNLEIDTQSYRFLLRGREIAKGRIVPRKWLAMNVSGAGIQLQGEQTHEPVFNLEATWVNEDNKKLAELHGFTVVDAASVLITHLSEILKQNCAQLLSRQDVQEMLDHLKPTHPSLINELIPDLASLGLIQRVLQNLLIEQVPIKHLAGILECIADYAPHTKSAEELSEQARKRLAPFFIHDYTEGDNVIHAITLNPRLEQILVSRVQKNAFELGLSIDPQTANHVLTELNRLLADMSGQNLSPIVIMVAELRLAFKRFFEPSLPRMITLSYQEIPSQLEVRNFGIVSTPPELRSVAHSPEKVAAVS